MKCEHLTINTDGACSGNPGLAGIGVVIKEGDKIVKEISLPIGLATNNVAEYKALVEGLKEAQLLGAKAVSVYTDSELMHRQLTGLYAVRHEGIKPLFDEVNELIKGFKEVKLFHVRRELNKEADRLSRLGLKANQDSRP